MFSGQECVLLYFYRISFTEFWVYFIYKFIYIAISTLVVNLSLFIIQGNEYIWCQNYIILHVKFGDQKQRWGISEGFVNSKELVKKEEVCISAGDSVKNITLYLCLVGLQVAVFVCNMKTWARNNA